MEPTARLAAILLAVAMAAPAASKADDAIPLDAACVAVGCLPADAPGWPITLSAPGSYRLTSNLDLPDSDTTAIAITSSFVHLDLSGFAIQGPADCSGTPPVCSAAGSGHGIVAESGAAQPLAALVIRNGRISGAGASGLRLIAVEGARLHDLRLIGNGDAGLHATDGGAQWVGGVTAGGNGGIGLQLDDGALLVGNRSAGNGDIGVRCGEGAVIRDHHLVDNGGAGIVAGDGTLLVDNLIAGNGGVGASRDGVRLTEGAVVDGLITGNGAHGVDGGLLGTLLLAGSLLIDNADEGLRSGASSGYGGNVFAANHGGEDQDQVSAAPRELDANLCGSDTLCP